MFKRVGMDTIMLLVASVMLAIGVLSSGCGDNLRGPITLVDAMPDTISCGIPDAGCCTLYPDEDAVRACAKDGFPIGACGVVACQKNDCTFAKVNVCHYAHCADLPCVTLRCDGATCSCDLGDGSSVSCAGVP